MDDGIREILALLGGAGGPDLPAATRIIGRTADADCALYVLDADGDAFGLRAPEQGIGSAVLPATIPHSGLGFLGARLDAGELVGCADDAERTRLRSLGFSEGVLVPARWSGRCVGVVHVRRALAEGGREAGVRTMVSALGPAIAAHRMAQAVHERTGSLDRRVRRLDAVAAAGRRLAEAAGEREVAAAIAREARALVGADLAVLFGRGGAGDLIPLAGEGWRPGDPEPAVVALTRDHGEEPVWLGREMGVAVGAPGDRGAARDLLVVARHGAAPFGDDDIARLAGLERQAAVALHNARLVERLRGERSERRALAAALVDAQEQERRRVAEDIHDGPVQELAGVSLLLDALSADLRSSAPRLSAEADRAAASARDAVRGLRRAIFDLHPMALDELGFAAATRTLVQRLEWRGVVVTVRVDAVDLLAPALRTVAFRTCQEAVANILRHAEPRRVDVLAHRSGDRIIVEVRDDGRGFDPDEPADGIGEGHLGLGALRERARLVGGDLQVFSRVGEGTRLVLALPLDGAAA